MFSSLWDQVSNSVILSLNTTGSIKATPFEREHPFHQLASVFNKSWIFINKSWLLNKAEKYFTQRKAISFSTHLLLPSKPLLYSQFITITHIQSCYPPPLLLRPSLIPFQTTVTITRESGDLQVLQVRLIYMFLLGCFGCDLFYLWVLLLWRGCRSRCRSGVAITKDASGIGSIRMRDL